MIVLKVLHIKFLVVEKKQTALSVQKTFTVLMMPLKRNAFPDFFAQRTPQFQLSFVQLVQYASMEPLLTATVLNIIQQKVNLSASSVRQGQIVPLLGKIMQIQ